MISVILQWYYWKFWNFREGFIFTNVKFRENKTIMKSLSFTDLIMSKSQIFNVANMFLPLFTKI